MPPNQFQWSMCNMQSKSVIKELLINALTSYVPLTCLPIHAVIQFSAYSHLLWVNACKGCDTKMGLNSKPHIFCYKIPGCKASIDIRSGWEWAPALVVGISARVTGLVVQQLEHLPDTKGNGRTQEWANPVNPVVVRERLGSHTWTETSGWVQTGTSVVNGNQVSQEQSNTNDERSHEGSSSLLNSHEQHSQTKKSSSEGLNEHTSGSRASTTQTVGESNWAWSHGRSGTSSSHTGKHLSSKHEGSSHRRDSTGQNQRQGDGRVQVTTRDSEEHENRNHNTETKTARDHDQLTWVGANSWDGRISVSNSSNNECCPQEGESTKEFTEESNSVVLERRSLSRSWGVRSIVQSFDVSSHFFVELFAGGKLSRVEANLYGQRWAIKVTKEDGAKYEKDSRAVVNKLLDLITLRLKEVTVTCDDYDTLMAIQAARRLYTAAHRETIPLPLVVEMNRRLIKGYQKYSDRPDVKELKDAVGEYNKKLMQLGIHDHQVESLTQSNRLFVTYMFFDRFFKVILFLGLAMPGVIMFGPIFLVAKKISRKKAQEALAASTVKIKAKDVIGTWKILVALGLAPALYIFWAVVATILLTKAGWTGRLPKTVVFILCYLWSVLTTYASLRVGEIGVDYYKSLKPLFYSLVSQHIDSLQLENLQKTRKELAEQVTIVCERFGPSMFDDFNEFYRDFNQLNDNDIDFASVLSYNDSTDLRRNASLNSLSIHNLSDVAIFSNPQDDQESIESDDKHPKPSEENETHSRREDYAESELPQEKVRLRRVVKRMEET